MPYRRDGHAGGSVRRRRSSTATGRRLEPIHREPARRCGSRPSRRSLHDGRRARKHGLQRRQRVLLERSRIRLRRSPMRCAPSIAPSTPPASCCRSTMRCSPTCTTISCEGGPEGVSRLGGAQGRGAEPRARGHSRRDASATTSASAAGTCLTSRTRRSRRSSISCSRSTRAPTRSRPPTAARARMARLGRQAPPGGQDPDPGVVTHHTLTVEHPRLVADRIVRYAKLVGRENVIAGTDCGFAQVESDRARASERDVGEVRSARRRRAHRDRELWGRRAWGGT